VQQPAACAPSCLARNVGTPFRGGETAFATALLPRPERTAPGHLAATGRVLLVVDAAKRRQPGIENLISANAAPVVSASTLKRPVPGMSVGGTYDVPPSESAFVWVASTSVTAK